MVFTLTTGNKLNNNVHLVGLSDSGKRTKMKNPLAVALNTVREIQLALVHDAEQVAKGRGIQHEVRHLLVRSLLKHQILACRTNSSLSILKSVEMFSVGW